MKRYKSCYVNCMMQEHPKGDWCRYEDVPGWVSVEERRPLWMKFESDLAGER